MEAKFSVSELIESKAERLVYAFRERLIPHSGALGGAREQVVRDFIQQQLPARYQVSHGFVFDAHETVSKQMDVVIYDTHDCPIFEATGGVKFFPCEGVVPVGQVKSHITSAADYEDALANLRSAKQLDRTSRGHSFSLTTGEPLSPQANHLHQMFSFLFIIHRTLQRDSMCRAQYEYLWNHPRYEWPNISFAFDQFFITHHCQAGICPNPMDAFAIGVVDDIPKAELLLWFTQLLAQAVVATHVASFSYYHHLKGDKPRRSVSFAFEHAPVKGSIPAHLLEIPVPNSWAPNTPM